MSHMKLKAASTKEVSYIEKLLIEVYNKDKV